MCVKFTPRPLLQRASAHVSGSFSPNFRILGAGLLCSIPQQARGQDAVRVGWHDPRGDAAGRGFPWGHSPRARLAFLTKRQLHTKAQWAGGCWVLAWARGNQGRMREAQLFPKAWPRVPPRHGHQRPANCLQLLASLSCRGPDWKRGLHAGGRLAPPSGNGALTSSLGSWAPLVAPWGCRQVQPLWLPLLEQAALERAEMTGWKESGARGGGPFLGSVSW